MRGSSINGAPAAPAGAGERVNMVAGWLYSLLAARRRAGGLAMDAPVLASVWNRLADGYQAFEACRCGGNALPLCIAALLLWLCAAAASAAASRCSTRLRCLRLWLERRICSRPASRDLFSGDLFSLTESLRGWEDAPHWQRTSCFLVRAMFAHRIDILAPDSIPSRTDTSLQMSAAVPAPPCSHLKGLGFRAVPVHPLRSMAFSMKLDLMRGRSSVRDPDCCVAAAHATALIVT